MDATTIARVLWAATRDLDSESATVAAQARQALANLLAAGASRGFPSPLEPSAADLGGEAWKGCSAAAGGAAAPAGAPGFALLAPLQAPGGTDLDHGLAWPGAPGSTRVARIGPLRRKGDGRDWYLETYAGIDGQAALRGNGDSRPGLYARIPLAPADIAPRTPPSRRAYVQSYLLFLAAVALALASVGVTYVASRVADGTVARVVEAEVEAEAGPCALALAASRETADRVEAVRRGCTPAWEEAWTEEARGSDTASWTERLGRTAWRLARVGDSGSLVAPLLLSYAAVLVLILAGGLATTGTWFGALVDNRNRVSLSRVQMLAWTVVLLGGYVVVGAFNVALLGSAVRDLTLNAGSWGAASSTTLQDFAGFFPNMDPALWAALGLTAVVSPFLSQMILNRKAREGGERIEARPLVPSAPLETREHLGQARWSDLVTGEEEANAGQVDVSRLQYLVITFMLLGSYLILLLRYLGSLEGTQILIAAHDHAPVFPSMPPVDGTFLALLALSHGGYLAFKALPSTGAGGITG